jgi:hypothetical protein
MRRGTRNFAGEAGIMCFTAVSLLGSGMAPRAVWFATTAGAFASDGETIACDVEPSLQQVPRTTGRVVSQQARPFAVGPAWHDASHGAHPPMTVARIRSATHARAIYLLYFVSASFNLNGPNHAAGFGAVEPGALCTCHPLPVLITVAVAICWPDVCCSSFGKAVFISAELAQGWGVLVPR